MTELTDDDRASIRAQVDACLENDEPYFTLTTPQMLALLNDRDNLAEEVDACREEVASCDRAEMMARAEAAEAKVAAVEALADEHERLVSPAPYTSERALIERLRAAIEEASR